MKDGRDKVRELLPKIVKKQPKDFGQMRRLTYELSGLPDGDVILFSDEMKLELNPKSGPDWTSPGQRKELVTPAQNCRRYIAGAYNPMTGHLVAVDAPKNDSSYKVGGTFTAASRCPKTAR